ncbi:MAG: NYN domain-containing protein [Novosphingobium sp.]|uniref:NYN domain-containing protein n=1 Tax=Novosphingobium sp. TaxID=1874826 RepID=UPI0032BDE56B
MASKSIILVDFDNIFSILWQLDRSVAMRFAERPMQWLPLLTGQHLTGEHRRWMVARCYLNPAGFVVAGADARDRIFFSRFRPGWVRAGFEVVDCPTLARGNKNAADIRMVLDAMDLLAHRTQFDEFVIASGDADFTPLLHRIRLEGRRATVFAPGFASSAYTSLADQVIDFEAIESLLADNSAAEPAPLEAAAPLRVEVDEALSARFSDYLQRRYDESSAPLNLAVLAQHVCNNVSGVRESGWLGHGSFSRAVQALNLPGATFSPHYLWDNSRHEPPVGTTERVVFELPEVVESVIRNADVPRLESSAWSELFKMLARYAAEQEFNLTEASRWTRDQLAEIGVSVSRSAVSYAIHGTQYGGAPVNRDPAPDADEIANAFFDNVLRRAEAAGMTIDEKDEDIIGQWLGFKPQQ